MTHNTPPADITATVQMVAARLLQRGAAHPVAAALAIAARGQDGTTVDEFAAAYGLHSSTVRSLEAGDVALEDLPDLIADVLDRTGRVDLLAMADLDTHTRQTPQAHQADG